jgi:hypothetical protein
VYKSKLCEFINFGGGFGAGRMSWGFFAEAFMDSAIPSPNMDWAASQNTTIACEMEL